MSTSHGEPAGRFEAAPSFAGCRARDALATAHACYAHVRQWYLFEFEHERLR